MMACVPGFDIIGSVALRIISSDTKISANARRNDLPFFQLHRHSWSAPFISNSQVIICLTGVTRAALKDVRLTDNTLLMPMHNDSVQR